MLKLTILVVFVFIQCCHAQISNYGSLVWSDEFDTPGESLDSTKWTYVYGNTSGTTGELQTYTSSNTELVADDTVNALCISAVYDSATKKYTSSRIQSINPFQYGIVEIRAKLTYAQGNYPAIWLRQATSAAYSWPRDGEIAMLKNRGVIPDQGYVTVQTQSRLLQTLFTISNIYSDYHIYTLDWNAQRIIFYIDGTAVYTYTKPSSGLYSVWPFDNPFNVLIDMAVGGSFASSSALPVVPSQFPSQFYIDYVRVYNQP